MTPRHSTHAASEDALLLARLIHRAVVCGVFWADGARDRASVLTRVDLDRSVSTGGTGAGLWGHHGPLV